MLRFTSGKQGEADVDEIVALVIIGTVIAYLAIRLIVFWYASRTGKRRDR